jgi:hypothetical protein
MSIGVVGMGRIGLLWSPGMRSPGEDVPYLESPNTPRIDALNCLGWMAFRCPAPQIRPG